MNVSRTFLALLAATGSLGAGPRDVPRGFPAVAAVFRAVAAEAAPALVRLHVERYAPARASAEASGRRRGFGRLLPRLLRRYHARPAGPVTGVLVRRNGLVLTSYHNVAGPVRTIWAELADGRFVPARRLGWDAGLDLAALKLEGVGRDLPSLKLASRRPPPVGTFVAVLGAGWGSRPYTLNIGIVSAHNRLGGRALQLNVRLNYGNTGGPVLDLRGRLVGVAGHVRPFGRVGLNSGVGFCTPARKILAVLTDLERGKRVEPKTTPFLGVTLDQDREAKRVFVARVHPGSGAEEAGLKVGDQLVRLAGQPVQSVEDVHLALARCRVGQVIEVIVRRGGRELRLQARLGAREE